MKEAYFWDGNHHQLLLNHYQREIHNYLLVRRCPLMIEQEVTINRLHHMANNIILMIWYIRVDFY